MKLNTCCLAGLLLLLLSGCSDPEPTTSGFAGLGTQVDGFAQVNPEDSISFPEDLGSHPDYRIEWWYVTANLQDEEGREWGLQWTLFRQAINPPDEQQQGWQSSQVWMAHAALTSAEEHQHAERFARGGVGQAGAEAQPFRTWLDDWQLASLNPDRFEPLTLTAAGQDFSYQVQLHTSQPWVLQGDEGFSQKSHQGQASWYYSQPFFQVEGEIHQQGESFQVQGQGWMDREWSSQPLAPEQHGWDWFSLHLDSGEKLMLFQLREEDSNYYAGTWISSEAQPTALKPEQIRLTPLEKTQVAGRQLPTHWAIEIADKDFKVKTRPLNPQAFMDTLIPYWEGPIFFEGSHSGRGFLEMTGY